MLHVYLILKGNVTGVCFMEKNLEIIDNFWQNITKIKSLTCHQCQIQAVKHSCWTTNSWK